MKICLLINLPSTEKTQLMTSQSRKPKRRKQRKSLIQAVMPRTPQTAHLQMAAHLRTQIVRRRLRRRKSSPRPRRTIPQVRSPAPLRAAAPLLEVTTVILKMALTRVATQAPRRKSKRSSRKVSCQRSMLSWACPMTRRPQLKEDGSG